MNALTNLLRNLFKNKQKAICGIYFLHNMQVWFYQAQAFLFDLKSTRNGIVFCSFGYPFIFNNLGSREGDVSMLNFVVQILFHPRC